LLFHESSDLDAFCYLYLPSDTHYPAEDLLTCPGLEGRLTLEMLRDFRAIIWLFLRLGRFEELFHVPNP
jgi:hypothetical protein